MLILAPFFALSLLFSGINGYSPADLQPYEPAMHVAQIRAEEMAASQQLTHYYGDQLAIGVHFEEACPGGSLAGEIIARNNRANPYAAALVGWMNSPTHREVILNPAYDYAGVGSAVGQDGVTYIVAVFCAYG